MKDNKDIYEGRIGLPGLRATGCGGGGTGNADIVARTVGEPLEGLGTAENAILSRAFSFMSLTTFSFNNDTSLFSS